MSVLSSDPIADMLTRIRNSIAVQKNEISLPHSGIKERVAKLLMQEQLVDDVQVSNDDKNFKTLKIVINKPNTNPRITSIEKISKPGRREYSRADKIPTVKNGRGLVVVSTSQGLMTGQEAKKKGIGGELICRVY